MNYSSIVKVAVTAALGKGILISGVVLAVIHSHGLSPFEQALIIASVGATITGLFTVLGAWIAVRAAKPVHDDVIAVKRKVEADRRESDQT